MARAQTGPCPHGLASSECLICQTLTPGGAAPPATRPQAVPASPGRGSPPERVGGLGLKALGLVFLFLLVVLGASIVWHLLRGVLHLVELVAVGAGGLWIGWSLGVGYGKRVGRRG